METESINTEENHKKGRQRKKQLYNSILKQMEFYFSDANLSKDRFLMQKIEESEFVDLETFLKFNKIRKLTLSVQDIVKAIQKSNLLELSEDNTKIKRKVPIVKKTNVDESTLYVEQIPSDASHEWLQNLFEDFGKVVYVSIPKYQHNKLNKGFAFVEFETEAAACVAIEFFESIGARISSQIEPVELCSIVTYEGNSNKNTMDEGEEKKKNDSVENEDGSSEENSKKRKKSSDSEEHDQKKLKVKDEEEADLEGKKKKKKSSKKKGLIKELGLQILPKKEWKKMRNRYLDMQKSKMKMLKQHLNKKRFNNKFEEKLKVKDETEENKNKLKFIPGVIVKMKLPEPCSDGKKVKNEIKNACQDVQYVEVPTSLNTDEAFLRFLHNETAKAFCESTPDCEILQGEEEKAYWEKIHTNRDLKMNKETKKQRGRDKLLKKAEKALGKHIRFDD